MGQILNAQGQAVDKDGKVKVLPGLDIGDPVTSLDLLGAVGRGLYMAAHQYSRLGGVKGERHVKLMARDVATLAIQGATVGDFASNVLSELSFSLAEAEARIAVLMGLMPEDKVQAAKEADMGVAIEWENRRRLFTMRVPITLRKKERLGLLLADTIKGEAPTQEIFDKVVEEAKAAGLQVEQPSDTAAADGAIPVTVDEEDDDATKTETPADAPAAPALQVVDGGQDAPLQPVLDTARALGPEE